MEKFITFLNTFSTKLLNSLKCQMKAKQRNLKKKRWVRV